MDRFAVCVFILIAFVLSMLIWFAVTTPTVTVKRDKISGANYVEYDDSIYKLVPLIEKGR